MGGAERKENSLTSIASLS